MLDIRETFVLDQNTTRQICSAAVPNTESIQRQVDSIAMSLQSSIPSASPPRLSKGNRQSSSSSVGTHSQSTLCVKASVWENTCNRFCRCQCHTRTQISTPRWMSSVLGTFFGSFTGYPLLGSRPCDYNRCQQTSAFSTQVLYVFPMWLASPAIALGSAYKDLSGPGASWTFRMPRVIPESNMIWDLVLKGHLAQIKMAFAMHQASIYDTDPKGSTLLFVLKSIFYLDLSERSSCFLIIT